MSKTICLLSLIACFTSSLWAQNQESADSVIFKENKVFVVRGEQQEAITTNFLYTHDVEITTNGTFTVGKDGKDWKFGEGQILLQDGWLVSPDGSFEPVMDHVMMKEGSVLMVRDGQAENLKETIVFPNQASITPDGFYSYPDGHRARLNDGEWFGLDGTPIPTKDAATLLNGKVVMQRDGSLFTLKTAQIMGMNDGTRVYWDGTVQPPTGASYKLTEGKTVLIVGQTIKR